MARRDRNTEQMRRRLEYDLVYIANWSLLLDIKVLLMTVPVVNGTNAFNDAD
jgi:lipopolysaccharide/colanic/teichoic acid biosynthesis glycosyltransferase